MIKAADLHIHTNLSDGTLSAKELIKEAKKAGLSAIAFTDHDIVDGIDESITIGRQEGVEVLSGIELSAEHHRREVHILGYLIDHNNQGLLDRLKILRSNRIERVNRMVAKLNEMGLKLDAQEVFAIANRGTVGRMHIALAMVRKGLVANTQDAFRRYIGDNSPAYVLAFRLSPEEAINLIRSCGGVPVLAHPYLVDSDGFIPQLVDSGLMGLEVYYPEHSPTMVNFYLDMAKDMGLLVTGGSDFHGSAKPEVKLGCIKLPYELVEQLKSKCQKT